MFAALDRCAGLAVAEGQFAIAARLFGVTDAGELSPACVPPRTQQAHQADVEVVRIGLGDDALTELMQEGGKLGLERAVALAMDLCERLARPAPPGVLSERERELMQLLARGYSNRHIADELVIGVRTVETDVERVLRKLGVDNRAHAML